MTCPRIGTICLSLHKFLAPSPVQFIIILYSVVNSLNESIFCFFTTAPLRFNL